VPRDAVEVIDTWDSLGLRATASHDVAVADVTVAPGRVIDLVGGEPVATGPLYAFPLFGLLAIAVSAVCTGIAEGAVGDVVALASARRPAGSSRSLAERETTQERVAEASGALRAAVAGVERAIASAWAGAEAGGPLRLDDRAALRIAATHAAQASVEVVDACHRLGGARALYRGSTLERRQRDVHTAAQHMVVAPTTMALAGRVLLGVEADTAQL
jgi:alkylation response protein AidB-like acyl-CoA dehydrogenase